MNTNRIRTTLHTIYLSIYLSMNTNTPYLSIYLSIDLSMHTNRIRTTLHTIYLSIYLWIQILHTYLSIHLSVYLWTQPSSPHIPYLYIHLSIYLWIQIKSSPGRASPPAAVSIRVRPRSTRGVARPPRGARSCARRGWAPSVNGRVWMGG